MDQPNGMTREETPQGNPSQSNSPFSVQEWIEARLNGLARQATQDLGASVNSPIHKAFLGLTRDVWELARSPDVETKIPGLKELKASGKRPGGSGSPPAASAPTRAPSSTRQQASPKMPQLPKRLPGSPGKKPMIG